MELRPLEPMEELVKVDESGYRGEFRRLKSGFEVGEGLCLNVVPTGFGMLLALGGRRSNASSSSRMHSNGVRAAASRVLESSKQSFIAGRRSVLVNADVKEALSRSKGSDNKWRLETSGLGWFFRPAYIL